MTPEKYAVYVDISAKIEAWTKDSVIAVSNGHSLTLRITSEVKIKAAALMKGAQPVQFGLMAVLAYIAIKPLLPHISRIILDMDYSGDVAKRSIVRTLIELIRVDYPTFKASHIRIENIAGHNADILAREAYLGVRPASGTILLEHIEAVLRK